MATLGIETSSKDMQFGWESIKPAFHVVNPINDSIEKLWKVRDAIIDAREMYGNGFCCEAGLSLLQTAINHLAEAVRALRNGEETKASQLINDALGKLLEADITHVEERKDYSNILRYCQKYQGDALAELLGYDTDDGSVD